MFFDVYESFLVWYSGKSLHSEVRKSAVLILGGFACLEQIIILPQTLVSLWQPKGGSED